SDEIARQIIGDNDSRVEGVGLRALNEISRAAARWLPRRVGRRLRVGLRGGLLWRRAWTELERLAGRLLLNRRLRDVVERRRVYVNDGDIELIAPAIIALHRHRRFDQHLVARF